MNIPRWAIGLSSYDCSYATSGICLLHQWVSFSNGNVTDTELCVYRVHHTKVCICGELIGQGTPDHPIYCPGQTLTQHEHHLCTYQASLSMPLYDYFAVSWHQIDTTTLTAPLADYHCYVYYLWNSTIRHFHPLTSFLCCNVPALHQDQSRHHPPPGQLVEWWKSDEMLCCLHVQAFSLVAPFAEANATIWHLHSHVQLKSYGKIGNNRKNRWAWCSRVGS